MSAPPLDPPEPPPAFYHTGGTLPPDTPSYVERQADRDLLAALLAGEYCYVLNARQMGKSSLCARTMVRLREVGVHIAFLDLQKLGGGNNKAEEWYIALLAEVGRETGLLRAELLRYWKAHAEQPPVRRLFGAIEELILPRLQAKDPSLPTPTLVVFVDEIDMTRSLPFSTDEFFGAIRHCCVGRATEPELRQLAFCLVGTASPEELIQDTRITPFNVGRRIGVRDFTPAEAAPLAWGLVKHEAGEAQRGGRAPGESTEKRRRGEEERAARAALERVLYWTGGHPYLTQRLCEVLAKRLQESSAPVSDPGAAAGSLPPSSFRLQPSQVDRLCEELFLNQSARDTDGHLALVRERLLKNEADLAGLLELYRRLLSGKPVPDEETNPLCTILKLSGVVKTEGGFLKSRNRIYATVFNRRWVERHMPDAEVRRQREAYRRGLLRASALAGTIVAVVGVLAAFAFSNERRARNAEKLAKRETTRAQTAEGLAGQRAYALTGALGERNRALKQARLDATRARTAEMVARNKARELAAAVQSRNAALKSAHGALGERDQALIRARAAAVQARSAEQKARSQTAQAELHRYAAIMSLIRREWDEDNVSRARELLAETRKSAFRGVEWDYWHHLCHPVLKTWDNTASVKGVSSFGGGLGFQDEGVRLGISADGKRVVTVCRDGSAKVWDTGSGRNLLTLKPLAKAVAISADGRQVACVSENGSAGVWDVDNRRELFSLGNVNAVVFSVDGRRITTVSADGTAKLWNSSTGRELRTFKAPSGTTGISGDGRRAVTIEDGTKKIRDLSTGQELMTLLYRSHDYDQAKISADGRCVVAADSDRTVNVWNVDEGKRIVLMNSSDHYWSDTISISANGQWVAARAWNGVSKVWDAETGREVIVLKDDSRGSPMTAISGDGRWLMTREEYEVSVWDVGNRPKELNLRTDPVYSVAFSRDGRRLVTGDFNGRVQVWDAGSGEEQALLRGHIGWVTAARFSADGQSMVTGGADGIAIVWDVINKWKALPLRGHKNRINAVVFSTDGRRVATASTDGTARIWDTRSGRSLLTLKGREGSINAVAFSTDDRWLVTGGEDGFVRIWDTANGRELRTIKAYPLRIVAVAVSANGQQMTATSGATAKVWDTVSGRELFTLKGHTGWIANVMFSLDGKRMFTCSGEGTAKVWDAFYGRELLTLKVHTGTVYGAGFSADGRRMASYDEGGRVKVWLFDTYLRQPRVVSKR